MLNMEVRVLRTIRERAMIGPDEHVLVAVSGGPDSMALLHCLHNLSPQLRLKLTVAHLNHRIRGAEADADEVFVHRAGESLGLPLVSESVSILELAAAEKGNLEEVARRTRYQFLLRTADSLGADKIALGHNRNDQAETVLMRLLRGSGSAGISGIHPILDGKIIRPLLDCSRSDILRYLEVQGVRYREDATNDDTSRMRNRVRHELIPYLEASFNPSLIDTLAREAEIARQTSDYLDAQCEAIFNDLRVTLPEGLSLPSRLLLQLHPAMSTLVLRRALKECRGSLRGVSAQHIDDLLHLCRPGSSGRRVRIPGAPAVLRQFEDLVFRKQEPQPCPQFSHFLPVPGRCMVEEIGMEFRAHQGDFKSLDAARAVTSRYALLNPALLPPILTVRSRKPGDRYGGGRHRKVKKMLIDAGIAENIRAGVPLVVAGDAVVWIPGFRPAQAFRAQPGADLCVMVEVRALK